VNLAGAAKIIRSKNAGPFVITVDVIFEAKDTFEKVRDSGLLNKDLIAKLYGIPRSEVLDVVAVEAAQAIKINIRRQVSAGSSRDRDVYGSQHHIALLNVELDLEQST